MDTLQLFWLSLLFICAYRIISSLLLFYYTKNPKKLFLQLLDFEFLETLNVNWILKRKEPNTLQRYLQSLEASFESAPQCVVQFYFLVKTGTVSNLTLFSLLLSIWTLVSAVVRDDKHLFEDGAQAAGFGNLWKAQADIFHFALEERISTWKCFKLNFGWFMRLFFRLFDILGRLSIIAFSWLTLGGYFTCAYVLFEFSFLLFLSMAHGKLSTSP